MERKFKMKISYFIKKKKEIKHRHQTTSTHKKNESISRTKPNRERETELASDKLALKTRRFQLQTLSNVKAAKCQQKPTQPRAAEFHSLRRIKINDNNSQVSDFHFQISTLMSKYHAHEQKLLVLLRTPSPQRPPGTNYQQLITCI